MCMSEEVDIPTAGKLTATTFISSQSNSTILSPCKGESSRMLRWSGKEMAVTYLRRIRENTRIPAKLESTMCRWASAVQQLVRLRNDISHKVQLTNTRGLKKKTSMFEGPIEITVLF